MLAGLMDMDTRQAVVPSAEAAAFLARTSGLTPNYTAAYTILINGLVTDGVWTKLDVLYIYATQDTTTALLNLVSTSFNGTIHGSPTFTVGSGFSGVDNSSTIYIDTGFNPTVGTPLFTANSAHLSVWIPTGESNNNFYAMGAEGVSANHICATNVSGGNSIYQVNQQLTINGIILSAGVNGYHLVTRPAASTMIGYRNAVSLTTTGAAATALLNLNIYSVGQNLSGTAVGIAQRQSMISIGGGLSGTDVTNFYNRLRTYMTAVGVP